MKRNMFGISWRFLAMAFAAVLVAGCGGGGSSSSSGIAGPAAVSVSIGTSSVTGAQAAPVALSMAAMVPSNDPDYKWPDAISEPSPQIAHVYMDIVRVSLLPSNEPAGSGDMDGGMNGSNASDSEDATGSARFITVTPDSPVRIDLMEEDGGKTLARLLGRFEQVPAGSYDKIRMHYRNVRVVLANQEELRFHPTAHSKFDIHFRQGHELVIPAGTDTTQQDGWVRFYRVNIDLVGLKLRVVQGGNNWNGAKVILRPQVFAEFDSPVLYSIAGTASNVSGVATPPVSGTFDISYGTGAGYPRVLPVAFDNDTTWGWSDDVLANSSWIVPRANTSAVASFRDRAVVEAIGAFGAGQVFQAEDILFTFPDRKEGAADGGWRSDNTFVLRLAADNVVYPMPSRETAFFDDIAAPHDPLTQGAIAADRQVIARGYALAGGIQAYWISVESVFMQ